MRVTIKSIAEAAKVSRGTVDKVLNNRPGVSQPVREKVRKIAQDLGYKPNLAGKALAYQKNPLKIGVIILSKEDPFFNEVYEGIQKAYEELKDFGLLIETIFMNSVDVDEQLRCIKQLEEQNISALALSPLNEESIKKELIRLTQKNIKIMTFNTDLVDIERMCFVGQNLIKSGRIAGELIGKLLVNGGDVAVITGIEKIKALQERVEGFKEIIKEEYPSIKIIDIIKNIKDNESSYQKTMDLMKKYPHIKAIYITGIGVGGVGKALKELNRKDIKIVCFDKITETVDLLKEKVIDFTITQEPFMQGYLPIKILFDYYFKNQQPASEVVHTKLEIKTKENIDH
ncbi:LacI family DNA-binding transcriptional regulator [Crassaminicella profunda]|uniref:LacI family DNA-binding transcriptional regulator n=1 Tax=Crassaminicella profunda TaxID=1286698 RepID=UPI001CA7447B|nr:LacI family DNA-binding transcriptional regulator [Crassaminicella profunda]QZY54208.1 LacI family DNA-binding transcriptional regulator [Crassaminicella profunda]